MLDFLNDLFWDLMRDLPWLRRAFFLALALLLAWVGASGNWLFAIVFFAVAFEVADWICRPRR